MVRRRTIAIVLPTRTLAGCVPCGLTEELWLLGGCALHHGLNRSGSKLEGAQGGDKAWPWERVKSPLH